MKYPAPPPNPVADALQTAGDALQASNPGATHAILGSNQLLQGKFVRIDVPNFNGAPNDEALRQKYAAAGMLNASPMASYLRLGAVPNELRKQIEAYIATADAAVAAGNPVPPPSGFAKSTGEDLALGVLAFADLPHVLGGAYSTYGYHGNSCFHYFWRHRCRHF